MILNIFEAWVNKTFRGHDKACLLDWVAIHAQGLDSRVILRIRSTGTRKMPDDDSNNSKRITSIMIVVIVKMMGHDTERKA